MSTEAPIVDSATALADAFSSNFFNISKPIENDTQRPHPKFATYCRKFCPTSLENGVKRLQEKRRQEMLDNLKKRREKIIDNLRPIIAFFEDETDDMLDDVQNKESSRPQKVISSDSPMIEMARNQVNKSDTPMQVDCQLACKTKKHRFNRNRYWRLRNEKEFRKLISKQLMLSEWLVDVPADFYSDWYMVFCPRGKRTLVIAANGQTRIYSRTGYFMFQFQSLLPGGCQNPSNKSSILDCVYVEAEHTFYVLDVISWNGCTFLDCETEFRFFWLQSRFAEEFLNSNQAVSKIESSSFKQFDVEMAEDTESSHQPNSCAHNALPGNSSSPIQVKQSISKLYNFLPLTHHECTAENIAKHAKGPYQFNTEIDGVLFFHKHAPYTPGITPLVCWLKVHMIPDILHISIDQSSSL